MMNGKEGTPETYQWKTEGKNINLQMDFNANRDEKGVLRTIGLDIKGSRKTEKVSEKRLDFKTLTPGFSIDLGAEQEPKPKEETTEEQQVFILTGTIRLDITRAVHVFLDIQYGETLEMRRVCGPVALIPLAVPAPPPPPPEPTPPSPLKPLPPAEPPEPPGPPQKTKPASRVAKKKTNEK